MAVAPRNSATCYEDVIILEAGYSLQATFNFMAFQIDITLDCISSIVINSIHKVVIICIFYSVILVIICKHTYYVYFIYLIQLKL